MSDDVKGPKKSYSALSLMQRSCEQATLFLVGHAWIGDTGARRLLELFLPEPGPKMAHEHQHLPSSS